MYEWALESSLQYCVWNTRMNGTRCKKKRSINRAYLYFMFALALLMSGAPFFCPWKFRKHLLFGQTQKRIDLDLGQLLEQLFKTWAPSCFLLWRYGFCLYGGKMDVLSPSIKSALQAGRRVKERTARQWSLSLSIRETITFLETLLSRLYLTSNWLEMVTWLRVALRESGMWIFLTRYMVSWNRIRVLLM